MFSFMNRLQTRIFVFFVVLLLAVQGISFWLTFDSNQRLEKQKLDNQLSVAQLVFKEEYDNRNYYLGAFAETTAKDFGLKEIFIDGDSRSFLVALNNHRKRIAANLAIAVNKEGKVIGQLMTQTDSQGREKVKLGPEQNSQFRYQLDTEFQSIPPLYTLDGRVYQLRFAPLTSGGDSVIGWVGFGYAIDNALANNLAQLTSLHTGFMIVDANMQSRVLSHSGEPLAANEIAVLSQFVNHGQIDADYVLWQERLGDVNQQAFYAYMFKPRADILQTLQSQWLLQLGLFVFMMPITLLLAFLISGSVTKPIKKLIEQARYIAKGNYDSKVSVGNSLEMQQLADEFTLMQDAVLSREKEIAYHACHDSLTGLANRNQLEMMTKPWFDNGLPLTIFLINIRRIGEVNVTLGHDVGDQVIKEVGLRLSQLARVDMVCRLSGDEYGLVFRHTMKEAEIVSQVDGIKAAMDKEYCFQEMSLHLQVTIGVSITPEHETDIVIMLRQADTALNHAQSQKLDFQVYDPQIDKNTVERLQLINHLKPAIEKNELVLFYQPKLNLATKQVTHVEALVRWSHPENGMIPPDVFIPIAEKTGQMNALTRWVVNEAIDQYHRWKEQGISLGIAINISAENLKDPEFCHWIMATIAQKQIPIKALTLEITEDAVVADPQAAIAQLSQLRQHGIKLSIDDYGTGYSSLAQLKQLPVHELKVDKSFVQQLMTDRDDQIIVESTILLAHNLGLSVVAEGVEDKATLTWLSERGCEMAQGFYLSRPVNAKTLSEWLSVPKSF